MPGDDTSLRTTSKEETTGCILNLVRCYLDQNKWLDGKDKQYGIVGSFNSSCFNSSCLIVVVLKASGL